MKASEAGQWVVKFPMPSLLIKWVWHDGVTPKTTKGDSAEFHVISVEFEEQDPKQKYRLVTRTFWSDGYKDADTLEDAKALGEKWLDRNVVVE